MNNILTNPIHIQGTVELTLTNCVTGEIEWQHTECNVVYHGVMWQMIAGIGQWRNTGPNDLIYISEEVAVPNEITQYVHNRIDSADTRQPGDKITTILNTVDVGLNSPDYLELNQKFNAPTNTRIINSVYVGDSGGVSNAITQFVNLTVPCRQLGTTTNETGRFGQDLTVKWRTEFFYNTRTISTTGVAVHPDYGWYIANFWVKHSPSSGASNPMHRYPQQNNAYWQSSVAEGIPYTNSPFSSATDEEFVSSSVDETRLWKKTYTFNNTIGEDAGRLFGQFGYGNTDINGIVVWAPAVPTDFPNKPIQPLHNHGPNNTVPFQDTNELAQKNGIVQITEGIGGWDNPDYPYHFLLNITTSGNVGVSRYIFRTKRTTGYQGNNWRSNSTTRHRFMDNVKDSYVTFNNIANGDGSQGLNEEYINVGEWIVWNWRTAGIARWNEITGQVDTIDDTTSPALGSAVGTPEVNQVAVEDDGTIWVADRINGLHKITDPFGSPTVITYTASTIFGGTPPGPNFAGSPNDGDENAVYGTAIGYQGRVWVVIDGAISWTENGGSSWTSYDSTTTPSITNGTLDGTFSDVDLMKVDREAENHEMVLAKDTYNGVPGSSANTSLWWWRDETGGETIAGPTWQHWFATTEGNLTSYGSVDVSRYGGTWLLGYSRSNFDQRILPWGSVSVGTRIGEPFTQFRIAPIFTYDRYNTPYAVAAQYRTGNDCGLYNGSQIVGGVSTSPRNTLGTVFGSVDSPQMIHSKTRSLANDQFRRIAGLSPGDSIGYDDPLFVEFTPFSQIVWDDYRWDSSSSPPQWRKNWNQPAVDSASFGPFPGIRKSFGTEDHEFKGISSIDVSDVIAGSPNPLTTDMTIVMTVKGEPKFDPADSALVQPLQTSDRVLIGMGAGRRNNFTLFWDFNGQIRIEEDLLTTNTSDLTAVPTDWTGMLVDVHRVVLVVSYTGSPLTRQYAVYLDGSQIGSTLVGGVGGTDLSPFTDLQIGATSHWREHGLTQQFAGFLEDVQIWDVSWTSGDVTTDHATWMGTKVPSLNPPAGSPQTLLARYLLTESLTNTETKLTHTSVEELAQNIMVNFADNTDTPSFAASDFYTVGIYDGIMKDNAIDWSSKFHIYFNPTDVDFTDFKNTSGTNIIPAAPEAFTEPLVFVVNTNLESYNGNAGAQNSQTVNFNNYGGHSFQHFASGTDGYIQWKLTSLSDQTALSLNTAFSGSYIHTVASNLYAVRFLPGTPTDYTLVGSVAGGAGVGQWIVSGDHIDDIAVGSYVHVYDDSGGGITNNDNGPFEVQSVAPSGSPIINTVITIGGGGHIINGVAAHDGSMRVTEQGTINILESGSTIETAIARWYAGDEFRIDRDGTSGTIRLLSGQGSPQTVIHTATFTNTLDLWPRVNFALGGSGIYDAVINYTRAAYTLNVGNIIGSPLTGKYDPDFLVYDNEDTNNLNIFIDHSTGSPTGSPIGPQPAAIKTIDNNTVFSATAAPAVSGEVVFCDSRSGVLKFHSSDAGKPVTGSVTVVYNN